MGISPGTTLDGERIVLSRAQLSGHGLILGATGSGKSMVTISILDQLRQLAEDRRQTIGWGVVDAKGELFTKVRDRLGPEDACVTVDFSGSDPVPYELLRPRSGETVDELVERRMTVLSDVLGRDGTLSLRMSRMARSLLSLAVEQELSFPTLECLLSNPEAAMRLAQGSANERVRAYFEGSFENECRTTLPALTARLQFLIQHERLRLSFGSGEFVDFRDLMDRGVSVLIHCGGPSMSQGLAATVQSLILSDLRRDVFSRQRPEQPYLFFFDEAQNLFNRSADVENLSAILTMSRSFGTHMALITQSLKSAISSADFAVSLETNFRWLIALRCGPTDAQILKPAIPLSGRVVQGRSPRGGVAFMTPAQELSYRLDEVANLEPRHAYFWLRGARAKAVLMRTHTVKEIGQQTPRDRPLTTMKASAIRERLRMEAQRVLGGRRVVPTKKRARAKASGDIAGVLQKLEAQVRGDGTH